MAARAQGRAGNGRRSPGRVQKRGSSSTLLWAEIGGAVLVGIVLIAIFSGKKSETPPRTEPEPEVAREAPRPAAPVAPAPAPKPAPVRPAEPSRSRATVPPARPAPTVDLALGRQNFGRAKELWNEALKLREQGKTEQSRDMLHEAYGLLGKALNSVDAFNLWDEEADLRNWSLDASVLATKREIGAWFELRSRIHKILPKRSQ